MLTVTLSAGALAGFGAFVVLAYRRRWHWTGLPAAPASSTGVENRPAKTLWDWLQLLGIPVALATLAFFLNDAQSNRDQQREDRQAARQRTIAADAEREHTLRIYLAQMSDLMLERQLLRSKPGADVRNVARTATLTTVRRLDGPRRSLVVRFLAEAGLLVHEKDARATVSLTAANLREADLKSADLSRADFSGADLGGANFSGAFLSDAAFIAANLREANFREASLHRADLRSADLRGADFRAFGRRADLAGADLRGANLNGAYLPRALFGRRAVLRVPGAPGRGSVFLRAANLNGADLGGADLRGANLRGTDLRGANLGETDLRGADLREANLRDTDLRAADLRRARGVDMLGSRGGPAHGP